MKYQKVTLLFVVCEVVLSLDQNKTFLYDEDNDGPIRGQFSSAACILDELPLVFKEIINFIWITCSLCLCKFNMLGAMQTIRRLSDELGFRIY